MRTMFGGSAAASEPKRKIAKRDRAAEKQAGRSVIRVVPGDPERRRRDGASSCISSWADWSIRARYRILLSGLVTNPGGGIGTRGGRGVRGRGVSGAEELRKKSARNTSAFSPELPREIPRSSSLSSTLATPGSWNTCESEHEQAGEGIAMKTILADNDVEGILAALVSNRRMPPPAAPRAHRSERLQIFQQIGKLSLGQLAQARDGVGAVGAGEGCAQRLGPAIVKVRVLVVKAAQGGWVVAAVGVV